MKYVAIIFFSFFSLFAGAQPKNVDYQNTDTLYFTNALFNDSIPFEITLTSDFKKLRREKHKGKYQVALLKYKVEDTLIAKEIKIKARGKNRKENCFFPPIAIKVKKEVLNEDVPEHQVIKLVMNCKQSKVYEKYVLKEYLCYKLYNLLSKYSFKTRLVRLTLIDTGKKNNNQLQMFAFVIEPHQIMAERLESRLEKNEGLTQKIVNQKNIMELAMFQFMIGNFDWAVPTQQNVKLIRPHQTPEEIHVVPYDFDYCGLVDANYAIPSKALKIYSVRDRIYLGECKTEEEIKPVIEKFSDYKKRFFNEITKFDYLEDKDKEDIIKYLIKFYEIIESGKFYKNYHLKRCKKIGNS
jgi:hypothetical protein